MDRKSPSAASVALSSMVEQGAQLASMRQTQPDQFLLPLVWYFLTSSQKLPPLRKVNKTNENVKGLFMLLTCIHVLLDFLAVSTVTEATGYGQRREICTHHSVVQAQPRCVV